MRGDIRHFHDKKNVELEGGVSGAHTNCENNLYSLPIMDTDLGVAATCSRNLSCPLIELLHLQGILSVSSMLGGVHLLLVLVEHAS